ncbi:hypothetical protein U2H26_01255 [Lysinibacillus irui]|nr:hypothetical protein [Lysinibacillus irui]
MVKALQNRLSPLENGGEALQSRVSPLENGGKALQSRLPRSKKVWKCSKA